MSLTRRSQSALEYMMTYGWAILVIVIVAAVLYSLGIFSPSSSLSTTVTGFSNLGSVTAECFNGGGLVLSLGDSTGNPIEITKINTTSQTGTPLSANFSTVISPSGSVDFVVAGACSNTSGLSYSNDVTITYTEPGQIFPGPYISSGRIRGTSSSSVGEVASFDGSSSIIIAPLTFTESNFTFVAWQNYPSSNGGDMIITSNSVGSPYSWLRNSNSTSYDFSDYMFAPIGPTNSWNLVVVTDNPSVGTTLYLNGAVDKSVGYQNRGTSTYVDIGAWQCSNPVGYQGACQFYVGSLADIQIYNGSLTLPEIQKLYQEGYGGAPVSNAGLIGWWPLDGNANDYSGYGNNAVVIHDIQWVSP